MKTILFYICVLLTAVVNAQTIYIPDSNFKTVLLASSSISGIAAAGNSLTPNTLTSVKIDINNNGEIEVNEVQDITYLALVGYNINDITGIEYFINLKYLFCWDNNIVNVDNVSGLTQLERMFCGQNQITSINLTNLVNLRVLGCQNNQFTSLNFANNPMLEKVFCSNNQLSSLDFSNNPLFNELDCKNNPNLTAVNIKNGTTQLLGLQTYYNECWTGTGLNRICADNSEMNALQIYLDSCAVDILDITFETTCSLANDEFIKNEVMFYPNPASDNVNIKSNYNIKTLELIDMQGRMLQSKIVNETETNIDISSYVSGIYIVKVSNDTGERLYKLIKN
jgi:Secretion system C-terminal sorting domain